eukprot:4378419-Amphidinium_carterae.1
MRLSCTRLQSKCLPFFDTALVWRHDENAPPRMQGQAVLCSYCVKPAQFRSLSARLFLIQIILRATILVLREKGSQCQPPGMVSANRPAKRVCLSKHASRVCIVNDSVLRIYFCPICNNPNTLQDHPRTMLCDH